MDVLGKRFRMHAKGADTKTPVRTSLQNTVNRVYERVPFYRRRFDEITLNQNIYVH